MEVPGGTISVWHRAAAGQSETVVLVHGLTGTSRWWSKVVDELPKDVGVISIDVRGRGRSAGAPPPYDLATCADDVVRCLDHFAVDKAIVAGYSMGGWIVAVMADRHPDRIKRLLLVDGGLALPNDPSLDPDDIIEAVVGPSLARLRMSFDDEEAFFDHWKAHPALADHWDDSMRPALRYELKEAGGSFAVLANPEAIRESAAQITVDPETRNVGATVRVPTHLIVVERGTADQEGGMIPQGTAGEAAAANPNLTMEYVEGINHYTLLLGAGAVLVATAIGLE